MKKEDIKLNSLLLVTKDIPLTNDKKINIKQGTFLMVDDFTINGNDILCTDNVGNVYIITNDDLDKIRLFSDDSTNNKHNYKVGYVLSLIVPFKVEVYRNEKSKEKINVHLPKDTQLVVRSVNSFYYNCTIITGEYKGFNISVLREVLEHISMIMGDIINGNFGDYAKIKTNGKASSATVRKFKNGDDIIYTKSYVKEQEDFMVNIGERCTFVSYLNSPAYDKRTTGIPLDCVVKDSLQRTTLANSRCFELYKKNKPSVKHNITVKVSGNRVRYVDELSNGKIAVGMSVCDKQDKFNLKTGLLLAMARAYNDKALQDYVFDMAKD